MAIKEHQILPLFKQFIKDTSKGKRTKPNGERIKPQTVETYEVVYRHLVQVCQKRNYLLRVCEYQRLTKRERLSERIYWKKFERMFSDYLLNERKAHDNYTGHNYRTLKTFFHYLNNDKFLETGPYFRQFKVVRQEVPVTALSKEHLQLMIYDTAFEQKLPAHLQRTKDMFVFGSTCALRFSDLMLLNPMNIETVNGCFYLKTLSKKTSTMQSVKLPDYAIAIVEKYLQQKKKFLFPRIALANFNEQLKKLGERMELTHIIPINRSKLCVCAKVFKC